MMRPRIPIFTFENYLQTGNNETAILPSETWAGQGTILRTTGPHTMKFGAELMKRGGGGSIVNISSIAGCRADPLFLAYTGTKWAVRGMSRAAARTLAPDGIRVNVVLPGIIDTPMLTDAVPGLDVGAFAAQAAPLGRAGMPMDVAQAVLFLVSDERAYVTGAELCVDGGVTA